MPQQSRAQTFVVPLEGGTPTSLAVLGGSTPLAADSSSIYLLNVHMRSIDRWIPPSGIPVETPIDTSLQVDSVVVYGDSVYLAAQDVRIGGFTNGVIARAPKAGGAFERKVTNIGHPRNLAADTSGLFWTEDPPGLFGAGPGRVGRSRLDGSNPTTVIAQNALALTVAGDRLYFSTGTEIDSISVGGGVASPLVVGLMRAGALGVSNGYLVWTDPSQQNLSDTSPVAIMTKCVSDVP
jgi:hypothetical protein